ncbi:MAG: hypothetical protein SFV51_02515 [Bryobacteraceae bacterium]|nr:hypothetical protein [Bryobacteraceae bacterium]
MLKSFTLLAIAGALQAQVIIAEPAACTEADRAKTISIADGPLKVDFQADARCLLYNGKGRTLRVWNYPHHYQRLAAVKWKVAIDTGDGREKSYDLPGNSVIGLALEQETGGKWKLYRGSSRNPISLAQPALVMTVRKADETKKGGLKQQHFVWDLMSVDALGLDVSKPAAAAYPTPKDAQGLRIKEVWLWQGLNPIPKKLKVATGKGKITLQSE